MAGMVIDRWGLLMSVYWTYTDTEYVE